MYLRKRISKLAYFVLASLLLIPTTINETKGTLSLLPLGLFVTFLIGSPRCKRIQLDPVSLVFGLGIGNASRSSLGEQFTGRYAVRFEPFVITSAAAFLLEIVLLGTGLVLLYWMIFRDALAVARLDNGIRGRSLLAGRA
jgi:hypothetical protein